MVAGDSSSQLPNIRAVVFDVGEVIIDETTEYGTWADWLGVPRHTFSAVFGAIIAQGRDYREAFEDLSPGFDLDVERRRRIEAGRGEYFDARDVYSDVRPCLTKLRMRGYWTALAGNQTTRAGRCLRELHLPVDLIATSDEWGVEKPSPEFFGMLISTAGVEASEIMYVGDRLDNDILPARQAGLVTTLIRRGPWGRIQATSDDAALADHRIDSLDQLPQLLGHLDLNGEQTSASTV